MSTAAKTPNYNLSQVAGSDIPDWITDYTSDMKKIDEALKENADDIATVRPDEFSEESTYAAGDYCIKDNVIYKAKTAVEAGAFDISDWTATTIFDELSGLNQNMPVAGNYPVINDGGIIELPYTADAPCRVMITGVSTSEDYQTYNVLINGQYVATRQFSNHASLTFRDSFYLRTGDTINASGQCTISAQLFRAN